MSGPTTVELTNKPSTDNKANQEVQQTVNDINALYDTLYQVGISQKEVDALIVQMLEDSDSSDYSAAGTNPVNLDIILTLITDANTIAGGLQALSQCINLITDLTSLATTGQNAFMDMCNNADDDSFDPTEDEQELQTSLDAFNETEFTIHYTNGSEDDYVYGLLNLFSNNSLVEGGEEYFWGDSGMSPMDASSASLINTSVEGITDTFTNWDDYKTYFTDIQTWASTTNGTGTSEKDPDTDQTDYIQETSSEISDINNSFGQIDSQLETNSTELANDLSYGMTLYEQFEGTIEEVIDSGNSMNTYIVNQAGH